jgi:DNA-binding NarL/FixJ family response regulator
VPNSPISDSDSPIRSAGRSAAESNIRLLLVDDEDIFLESTAQLLRKAGYPCDKASDPTEAARALESRTYDVVLSDIMMQGVPQLEFIRSLRRLENGPGVILMTAYPTVETAIEAMDLGVSSYLVKPFGIAELLDRLEQLENKLQLRSFLKHAREYMRSAPGDEYELSNFTSREPRPIPAEPTIENFSDEVGRLSDLLTAREAEVVRELASGYRVSTISRDLKISPHTVRRHLKNVFMKLGVNSQAELLEKLKPRRQSEAKAEDPRGGNRHPH